MGRKQQQPTARIALSAEQLANDFAAAAPLARRGLEALREAIEGERKPAVEACLAQWRAALGKTGAHDLARSGKHAAKLPAGRENGRENGREDSRESGGDDAASVTLFALHTYYALLVKLLAVKVAAFLRQRPEPLPRLCEAAGLRQVGHSELLRREMSALEAGEPFRDLDLPGLFPPDPFAWYTAVWSPGIEAWVRDVAARLAQYDPAPLVRGPCGGGDLLRRLYQELIPRSLRHELGEYYTPDWLADHVLDQLGYAGDPEQRVLDPACGSGTFLLRAIGRVRARGDATTRLPALDEETLCQKILANVVGYELSPVAVLAARANYLIALGDLVRHVGPVSIPVVLCDSILDGPPSDGPSDVARPGARFDLVMGNPPWIAWDNLPADYRQATKPLWQHYGLFSLGASEARHGGAKKDLSMLMAYVAADRYLKQGGRMGLVITQTLFQTKGAGEGFRRFRLGPTGDGLRVLRVDDLAATNPFPGAASRTSTIVLEKGLPTQYPVPYVQWLKDGRRRTYLAQPVEPERAGSPWFLRPDGFDVPLERLIGPSDYTAHLGANSGGANGVYWVTVLGEAEGGVRVRNLAEKNRRSLESVEQVIEPDLLYPLLCWGDVARYRAVPSAAILLAQDVQSRSGIDPAVMGCRYPRTLAYLERFQGLLTARAAYRRYQGGKAFYSMYNVGPYTVAPIKVVWRRMDRRIRAAVVEEAAAGGLGCRPVVPQETCVLIAVDSVVEAHYLCAVLNSAVVHFLVASHSIGGGKGFGTPGILDFVRLKRFDAADGRHRELAVLSQEAHRTLAESRVGQAMRRPTRESESGNRACTRGSALRLTHPTIPPHGEAAGGASQTGQPSICALSDAIVKAATEAPPMPRFARPTLQSGAMIDLQGRIDRLAAALWDLTPGQGEAIASLSETASPSE